MTLLQLTYFLETVYSGTTQKAAEKLNVSQSTISVSIKTLEKEFDTSLFVRNAKGMQLTEAGTELKQLAENLQTESMKLRSAMAKYSARTSNIRIGMPPLMGQIHMPDIYLQLTEAFPDTRFEIVLETRLSLYEMYNQRLLDIILVPRREGDALPLESVGVWLMRSNQTTVCMSVDNPLADRKELTIEELLDQSVFCYRGGESMTALLTQMYAEQGAELKFRQRCTQISTLIALLRRNLGIAYLLPQIVQNYPDLVGIPLKEEPKKGALYLVREKNTSVTIKEVSRLIERYFLSIQGNKK